MARVEVNDFVEQKAPFLSARYRVATIYPDRVELATAYQESDWRLVVTGDIFDRQWQHATWRSDRRVALALLEILIVVIVVVAILLLS